MVRDVRCTRSDKRIVVRCRTLGPADAERAAAERKGALLEQALERKLVFSMTPARNATGAEAL